MNIWTFLKERMLSYTDKIALVCGDKTITYSNLIKIIEDGYCEENHDIVICENSDRLENAINILKNLAQGNIVVPLNFEYGQNYCSGIRQILEKGVDSSIPDKTALIMFTSGSSGKPKGVMLSHENVIFNICAIDKYFKITKDDKILIARPLMHAAVLTGEFFISLYKGLEIHFYNESFQPQRIISYIDKNNITVFCATPTIFNLLCKSVNKTLPIRVIAVSGEILPVHIAKLMSEKFIGTDIYCVYGLTEASPRVAYLPPDMFCEKPGAIGYSIDGVETKIIDGRLFVKSPGIMLGYLSNPDLTSAKIIDGWLDTADMAKFDETGCLYILGRADNMIIRAGINIYPEEIEAIFTRDPRIERALCYGESDILCGTKLCLDLVGNITKFEASEFAKSLPSFMRPSKIEIVSKLALGASGKVIRHKNSSVFGGINE